MSKTCIVKVGDLIKKDHLIPTGKIGLVVKVVPDNLNGYGLCIVLWSDMVLLEEWTAWLSKIVIR